MSKQARGTTQTYYDTLRQNGCDTAYRELTLTSYTRDFKETTYATHEYNFVYGSYSKWWFLADSSHLAMTEKAYIWHWKDANGRDTSAVRLKLTRSLRPYRVASNRTVGFSPANLSSASAFANSTTDYGGYLTIASTYGNAAIKERVASYSASFWRMMTEAEWGYLLNTRSYSHRRYDFAVVSGVNGVILYPDAYTPSSADAPTVTSGGTVTAANWRKMQLQGCVFLPCAGRKSGSSAIEVGTYGWYITPTSGGNAYGFDFNNKSNGGNNLTQSQWSFQVRLVRPL